MFHVQEMGSNVEKYILHPRNRLSKTLHSSFSGIISSKNPNKKTYEKSIFNENSKINIKEDTFYKLKRVPPVYFYRKILNPYKYNMNSVPEYLIKSNEEKHFMNKLNLLMTNESDRKALNNMIKSKEKEQKFKDRYKPSILDIHNFLRFRPNLYSNSFLFEKRSNSVLMKENNSIFNNSINTKFDKTIENNINEKEKDKENVENKNDININDNNDALKEEKKEKKDENENEIKVKKDKKDEISEEDQIKYKYKISDIYNFRNEKVITDKSAEKYLFKNQENKNNKILNDNNSYKNANYFDSTSKSKSDWIPNRTTGTKMNSFSSVSYNILSPLYKGYNKFISPSELNKNNLYNESTAFHRVKSISEFIDLTRVSATNTLHCFNRKNKIPDFRFKNMIATDQADEFYNNRNLVEKAI